ncbi:MAG: hypothetical protein ACOYMG_27675 [Candidatus Methylumidiphilus sp.]
MLIEPEKLLMMAKKAGFKFHRLGEKLEVVYPVKKADDWMDTIKQYKPALVLLLQDEEAPQGQRPPTLQTFGKGGNYDLFGYDALATGHTPPPKTNRRKTDKGESPESKPMPCELENP